MTSSNTYLTAKGVQLSLSQPATRTVGNTPGADIQIGGATNDVLHGAGSDTLYGGLGDDNYYLWDSTSKVVEKAGEGIDTVNSMGWGNVVLSANVENLILNSIGSGTGNALNNIIIASQYGSTLDGKAGDDVLVGGASGDIFHISAGNGSDAIVNFQPSYDIIQLDGYGISTFAQLKAVSSQVGSDVMLKFANGEVLAIRDTQLSSLSAYDFGLKASPAALVAGDAQLTGPGQATTLNGWYVLNNTWGSGDLSYGKDYTITSSYNKADLTDHTTFTWSFPASTEAYQSIKAYPEVIFGPSPMSGGHKVSDTAGVFPVEVGSLSKFNADFDVSFEGNKAGFDVAFDIWLTNKPNGGADTVTNEVMIWLHKGGFDAYGDLIGTYNDGNISGKLYVSKTGAWNYTALVLDQDYPTGSIDLAAIFQKLVSLGIVSPSEYIASVELGAEVASGSGSLTINNLDFTVQSENADGSSSLMQVTGTGSTSTVIPGGSAGDDTIVYNALSAKIIGGAGNDTLILNDAVTVDLRNVDTSQVVGAATKVLGFENVDASGARGAVNLHGLDAGSKLTGSTFADTLIGGTAGDIIHGGDGADYIDGGAGADKLYGDAGDDRIVYDASDLVIDGGAGRDTLILKTGAVVDLSNYMTSQVAGPGAYVSGFEHVDASAAASAVTLTAWQWGSNLTGSAFADTLTGGAGWDVINGGDGNDYIDGHGGGDYLYGGAGNDRVVYNIENSVIDGGAGSDTLILKTAATVNLGNFSTSQVAEGNAYVKNFENVDASDATGGVTLKAWQHGSTLTGSAHADTLIGDAGWDVINGGDGNDYIDGSGGGDYLYGGAGDDRMVYNAENSVIDGGAGNDTLILKTATTVNLANYATSQVAAGNAYVKGFENVDASGANAGVTLTGSDSLNKLVGSAYADVITSGGGANIMTGGNGADVFKFTQFMPGKIASITDFSSAQGDKIDLSAIDAISGGAKNAFSFIGDHAFDHVAGELRFGATAGGVMVQGDTDGNGVADFSIFVATASLTQHDFVV